MKQTIKIHIPVLLEEIINNLHIKHDGSYIDATAGFGGHSSEIVKKLNKGNLYCIDQDKNAINFLNKIFKNSKNVEVIKTNFENIDSVVNKKVDGIIFDLGVSSLMFDDAKRGFSYKNDGPLDMRMNQESSLTAEYIINNYTRAQLIDIFKKYADINNPSFIVNKIINYRQKKNITSTIELANLIGSCFKGPLNRKHPAKTFFQALRIEVNKELEVLKTALIKASMMLNKKGRLLVISFHSIEDRIVKQIFKELSEVKDIYEKNIPLVKLTKPEFKLITKKPITPSEKEINQNKRSHSAKLRIIEKL